MMLGAALGVTGYRRVSRLARLITPGRGPARGLLGVLAPARRGAAGGIDPGGGPAGFLRDVRIGMTEYLERYPGGRGHTLEGQQVRGRCPDETVSVRGYPGVDYAKDGR
jgi:hypothetical protein